MSTKHLLKYRCLLLFLLEKRNNILQKEGVLKHIDNYQLNFLIEIVYNVFHGVVIIPSKEYQIVKRYRHLLRKLIDKKKTIGYRKKLLIRNRKKK